MIVIDWNEFTAQSKHHDEQYAAAIGVFDGIHIGHQALIKALVQETARKKMIITFRENPKKILRPESFSGDITTLDQKLTYFENHGIDSTVIIDFSENFSTIPGEVFVRTLVTARITKIIIGWDFSCGYNLDTPSREVARLARELTVDVEIIPPVISNGEVVSSTKIRKAIREGNIQYAVAMLGHPYALDVRMFNFSYEHQRLTALSNTIVMPEQGTFNAVLTSTAYRYADVCTFEHGTITWRSAVLPEQPRFIELIS
ncbi:MAG TPA: FAD synthetase family protein [Spirochaetia bacterium]|nr:FAD synthetase family protein [Spirochaetales bacterium]HRS65381.1 FAD synthetase family protein [Spirochaetia bacterium]HOT60079.1 FAD synthetase family protein [Spirochaetales bacterium]HPD79779.1 FAD synthetase family protein [Spirochaetales bacterium]HQG39290.1 FAD synthetase family protein [Spirochaetales bacterium]